MTREKTQEELEEEEEEEDSEDTDAGSSPSSAILPGIPGMNSKRSSRYNLEEIHIDGDLTSDSMSPRRVKKQWRTSIDDGFYFGSSWLKFMEANQMTPVMEKMIQPMLGEFIGTFLLTFAGVCVGCSGHLTSDAGPVSTGLTVMLVIMALGPISGAHINPSVSIGFSIIGELNLLLCFLYVISQILGSTVAALVARALLPTDRYIAGNGGMVLIPPTSEVTEAIGAEVVATFFLVFVVLHMAADQPGSAMTPVAIGLTVIVNIYAVGGISGCCMNAARSIGASIAATGQDFLQQNDESVIEKAWMHNLWYLIGTVLGTGLAGVVYRFLTAKNPKYGIRCESLCKKSPARTDNQSEIAAAGAFSESTDPC